MTIEPQRPYIGVHLLIVKDDKILLMKRTVKDSMDGMYALVAGKMDSYESPRQAAIREAKEEVGISILVEDLEHILTVHHANTNYKTEKIDVVEFYFKLEKWEGVPQILEPDKASELDFFPLNDLPSPTPKGLLFALEALKGGPRFVEN
jgi:ADP-ribose pyrophosphatase YjhB (NUDIX family)